MAEHFPEAKREAVLLVSAAFLVELCKPGSPRLARVVTDALPSDATWVRAGHDDTGQLQIVVQSAAFEPVPHGKRPPDLPSPSFRVEYAADLAAEARAVALADEQSWRCVGDERTENSRLLRRLADALDPPTGVYMETKL